MVIPHNRPTIGKEEIEGVVQLLKNNELTVGNKVKEFEKEFSRFIGLRCASVSSGTAALHLALKVLDIKARDEVIIPSFTCASVGMSLLYLKARPLFVDIGEDFNLLEADVEKKITKKTKAVIVPHMFGYPADIQEIQEICEKHGLFLIEDCAQSIGATCNGKKVGRFGDISVFSFNSLKLMTSVQGGMVCSNDQELIGEIESMRHPDTQYSLGDMKIKYSYMMSDLFAAIGITQLRKLDSFIEQRKKIASTYRENIKDVIHPEETKGKSHVFSWYVIKSDNNPEKLINLMKKKEVICTRMHFPPLHQRKIFTQEKIRLGNTERLTSTSLSLPIFPSLSEEEAHEVTKRLNEIIGNGK